MPYRFSTIAWMCCFLSLPLTGQASSEGISNKASIDDILGRSSFAGPQGFQSLCLLEAALCESHTVQPKLVYSARLGRVLLDVQQQVNADIISMVEPFGQDRWQYFPIHGDCEDYALSKYQLLLEAGLAVSDLRFAVAFTELNEYHAVLLVETDQGTIVLDNRFDQTMSFQSMADIGYRWIAAQKRGSPTVWSLTDEGQALAMAFDQNQKRSSSTN